MARWDPIRVATLLEEFGMVMYEEGSSRRNYAETVNSAPTIPVLEFISGRPMEAFNDLGRSLAGESSPSHAGACSSPW